MDNVDALRGRLARLTGPNRAHTVVELGQALQERYWRSGPGSPAGLPDLTAAIEAFEEANGYLDETAPVRGILSAYLGWLLGLRHGAHGTAATDRERAIALLEEALRLPHLPPIFEGMARLTAGQLHLGRAAEEVRTLNPAAMFGGGGGGVLRRRSDVDTAVRYCNEVLAGPASSADMTGAAKTCLSLAEALQAMHDAFGGGVFDTGRSRSALTMMQRVQPGMPSFTTVRMSSPASFMQASTIDIDPLDYRVAVLPDLPVRPAPPSRTPAATGDDLGAARKVARARLAELSGAGDDPWQQALVVLSADAASLDGPAVDAFVSTATNAVDVAADVADGLDRFLLAVAMRLRGVPDGWDDGNEPNADLVSGVRQLRSVADLVPASHPAAGAVVEALGSFLDRDRPLSGPVVEVAEAFEVYASSIADPAPVVTAIGQLCRSVAALRRGHAAEPISVDALAVGHGLRPVLTTAAAHVRLAAAVRSRDAAGIRSAAGASPLADVLAAIVAADPDALAAATERIPATRAGDAAIAGAVRLRCGDLTGAVEALRRAVTSPAALDADYGGLRTRTWWRLAAAYRRRGAAGDAEECRRAGLAALRGADQDIRTAGRFAGWMLADGRAAEAFTALEVAAALDPPVTTDPLVGDVTAVLLGLAPPGVPAPEPPTPEEVAAALRTTGATALLYLHPTDEPGHTVGVLCLDAATDRLDVAANVPVTDPLVADDPTWSAIAGRWAGPRRPRVVAAVTGSLAGMALPAARVGSGRRLVEVLDVTRAGSGGEVVRLAARQVPPVDADPVFVVNPLTRLDCGLRLGSAGIELAGGAELDLAGVPELGGLVILPPSDADTFDAAASALLAAGCCGVVGWLRHVDPAVAALARFILHTALVAERLAPAEGVGFVQRWMLDSDRAIPPNLPAGPAATAKTIDLTDPALWAPMTYRGR